MARRASRWRPSTVDGQPLDELIAADPRRADRRRVGGGVRAPAAVPAQGHRRRSAAVAAGPSVAGAGRGRVRPRAGGRGAAGRAAPDLSRRLAQARGALRAAATTEALCGFREPDGDVRSCSSGSACRQRAAAGGDRSATIGRRGSAGRRCSSGCCGWASRDATWWSARSSRAAAARSTADGELGLFARTARELGRALPRRPRRTRRAADEPDRASQPDEAIFLPAGNLHAYLRGGGRRDHGQLRQRDARRADPQAHRRRRAAGGLDFTPGFRRADPAASRSRGRLALPDAGAGVRPLADRAARPSRSTLPGAGTGGSCW